MGDLNRITLNRMILDVREEFIKRHPSYHPTSDDLIKQTWLSSSIYKSIFSYIDNHNYNNAMSHYDTEFRSRGIVFYRCGDSPSFLITKKISKIPFWELTFKGGHEPEQELKAYSATKRELIEEIIGKQNLTLNGIEAGNVSLVPFSLGTYIDSTSLPKNNSDIMIRSKVIDGKMRIKVSFLSTTFFLASSMFNLFKANPQARLEHSEFAWGNFYAAFEFLKKSAAIGMDKDFICLEKLVKNIDLSNDRLPVIVGSYKMLEYTPENMPR